ncbi:MAG: hypothetical protein GXO25_08355 [Euryarchaeota archaeon]|nr:hypothetical protein [Euryarchaeota archaeon]
MYPSDILAGIVLILSALFVFLSVIGYRRYKLKALLMNIVVFSLFFIDSLLYALNSLYSLGLDMLMLFLLSDVVILVVMYLAVALKR